MNIHHPSFTNTNTNTKTIQIQQNVISRQRLVEVSLSSGNYSRLLADVIFTRSMGYYMIQVDVDSDDDGDDDDDDDGGGKVLSLQCSEWREAV